MISTNTHTLKNNKINCMGCAACVAICPQKCISMQPDDEGFLHPKIDIKICNDCDLCRKICPVHKESSLPNQKNIIENRKTPSGVFAAWCLDDNIRKKSSSGGVFSVLAEYILAKGGVVVGAAFDEQLIVHHIIIETNTDLSRIRGAKYVQSRIDSELLIRIRKLLKQDIFVMFSGTPCQISGLRNFLCRPYDNLFCCDIVCHGVPSPKLLEQYCEYCKTSGTPITKIDFRDKTNGWKKFGVRQYFADGSMRFQSMFADPYMSAFLKNYSLREACYRCRFANTTRHGDLTIADFWRVAETYPKYDTDDKGTSLIMVNTEKGASLLNGCQANLFIATADVKSAITGNKLLVSPVDRPPQRSNFYLDLESKSFQSLIRKYKLRSPSLIDRIINKVRLIAKNKLKV